jgi:hypothetical protein
MATAWGLAQVQDTAQAAAFVRFPNNRQESSSESDRRDRRCPMLSKNGNRLKRYLAALVTVVLLS